MEKVLKLYKKMGETPLECIERFRGENNKDYTDIKMSYVGRLDPMAEGELLVLVGEECKNREKYLGLDKEYEVDILFGFETDTYDVLGLLNKNLVVGLLSDYDVAGHGDRVREFLEGIMGRQIQKYPPFSSKTIGGKALFELSREGKLNAESENIPEKEIVIYEAELLKNYWIKGRDLKDDIFKRILLVRGDFRQEEILEKWNGFFEGRLDEQFLVSKIRVRCSSGTYMRSIAHNMGKKFDIGAIALRIKRNCYF